MFIISGRRRLMGRLFEFKIFLGRSLVAIPMDTGQ